MRLGTTIDTFIPKTIRPYHDHRNDFKSYEICRKPNTRLSHAPCTM